MGSDSHTNPSHSGKGRQPSSSNPESTPYERSRQSDASRSNGQREVKWCLLCHKVGHLVKDCWTNSESRGPSRDKHVLGKYSPDLA